MKWQGLEIEGKIKTGEKTRKRERREGERKRERRKGERKVG